MNILVGGLGVFFVTSAIVVWLSSKFNSRIPMTRGEELLLAMTKPDNYDNRWPGYVGPWKTR